MERKKQSSYALFFLTVIVLVGASVVPTATSVSQSSPSNQGKGTFNGQILFAPWETTTTYLMDSSGTINHTWPSTYQPFTEAYWLGDGSIMRPITLANGGGLQRIRWDGSLAWDYRYTVSGCTCHHDVKCLPNGDVLMIVWVTKTRNQAIQAGRNPSKITGNTFTPDRVIEVKPTGQNSGDVVWEWNVWDHLIQDYDSAKDNYGVVGDHPELIDVNFGDDFVGDWLHTNSLDYDPNFDQVLVDVHNFDEVWVIDHSTTTEEAAGHTGGQYGHGGDLLYRWGNPQTYRHGTDADQIFFGQHDATWIKPGYPGAGHIMVFNNGYNRPGPKYSTVDEFAPPIDDQGNYYLESDSAYGPENLSWSFVANPPTSMYSEVFGGEIRLMDGNTLICDGIPGKFLEVNPDNTIIWQFTNPYPNPSHNDVFKIEYVTTEEPPNPPVITGPQTTNALVPTSFNFTAQDPNGDDVEYYVNWGDYTNSSWLGPYPSGQNMMTSHAWTRPGQYTITAKAKDSLGQESTWSNAFPITVVGAALEVTFVAQGTGVSAIIKNTGTLTATNVTWKLQVNGGILGLINKVLNGIIDVPAGNSTTVGTGVFLGFGPITIKATVAGETKTAQGIYLFIVSRVR